jgi:translation initiation factor 5B
MSGWISQVDSQGQPKNAVTVIYIFGATILCTILPSQVAFYSLVSAGGVPTIAAYGLISLLRLTQTPDSFQSSYFYLGRYRKLFYLVAVLFNALIVAVRLVLFLKGRFSDASFRSWFRLSSSQSLQKHSIS